jgi:hypothetical protein
MTGGREQVVSKNTQSLSVCSGLEAFRRRYPKAKAWLVGSGGIHLDEFFSRPVTEWFQ